ncbi:MAG: VirB3 family type IV secretion system protein [Neisseriaceae bacterium]|nr:VirB3 family type IV secretion system protein [Neisseriaceae bacterium]MCV2508818.1 VirB3 family type IV secretion system protein [Neisseriaceae bacterium]
MNQRIDEITFNGLDRPAMFAGAPIKPMGISFISLTMLALLGSMFYGLSSFLLMLLIVPIWFILKLLCEHDENALNVWRYNISCYFAYRFNLLGFKLKHLSKMTLRKNHLFKIPTYLPISYGDEKDGSR